MPLYSPRTIILLASTCLALAAAARGDVLVLKSGGEIRGRLEKSSATGKTAAERAAEPYTIRTLGGALVTVARDEVEQVIERRPLLEEYETRRRATPDTAQDQWELSEWCREHTLLKERATHLERVVALDPENAAAHRGLGHVKHQGRWTTRDALMADRGYVKHKGKYILPQELELLEEEARASDAEKAWFRKVTMWRGWLHSDRTEVVAQAVEQLRAIHDPDAVAALARSFREEPSDSGRLMAVEIISQISGDKPFTPLVQQSLNDPSEAVRLAAARGACAKDANVALSTYLKSLRHESNEYVNRAAAALAVLGDDAAVPHLIESLVTTHQFQVQVPDPNAISMSTDGSMGGSQSILPPNIEAQLRTGRLAGAIVQGESIPMKTITVDRPVQNAGVLSALDRLTGEDLGYDIERWRQWYRARQNGTGKPKRSRSVSAP